jgi:predicted protein tyrosine phosphatase
MKALFIQPSYPDTFWSLRHALKFISKKAVYPPLGLMTVSAMTPVDWTKKLVDLNASFLKDEQIMWADVVFKMYHKRVLSFLKSYNPPLLGGRHLSFDKIMALIKSVVIIGILEKNRKYYWELLLWSLFRKPKVFPLAITYSIQGYHYRKIFRNIA